MTTFGGCIYATQTMVIIQFHFIIDTSITLLVVVETREESVFIVEEMYQEAVGRLTML